MWRIWLTYKTMNPLFILSRFLQNLVPTESHHVPIVFLRKQPIAECCTWLNNSPN